LLLGLLMMQGDILNAEVEAAIQACNKYPDTVEAIYIGNENLPAANAKDMIAVRNRIKERCGKPIGTVQTIGYWLNKSAVNWELFWAMDWWGYNAYPFFGPLGGKSSVDILRDQIGQLQRAYPDVFDRFRLTETGWPSEGGQSAGNVANWNNAKSFADGVADMLCNGEIKTPWMSYFIFNDPMYKKNVPEFEKHFGVASPSGVPKWDISRLARCGSTSSDQAIQVCGRRRGL
jgi:exo-beta-1,3-glucanase (GH17 family)